MSHDGAASVSGPSNSQEGIESPSAPIPGSSTALNDETPSSGSRNTENDDVLHLSDASNVSTPFKAILRTPEILKKTDRKPRKAINSRAVHLRRGLFGGTQLAPENSVSAPTEEEEIEGLEAQFLTEEREISVTEAPPEKYSDGDYVVGKLVYNFGTAKEIEKQFVGIIVKCSCGKNQQQYEVNFLRKQRAVSVDGEVHHYFTFPCIQDKWFLDGEQIVKKIDLTSQVRGKHYFTVFNVDGIE